MNKQIAFYRSHGIDAVEIVDSNLHDNSRDMLYGMHLAVPRSYWRGRVVLEFGPNRGDNATYYAALGAQVILSEPMEEVHGKIIENFTKKMLPTPTVHALGIEDAGSLAAVISPDVVVAEGFLVALETRHDVACETLSALRPDIFIFSINNLVGSLWEVLRRRLARELYSTFVSAMSHPDAITELTKFFSTDFQQVNSGRDIRNWVMDGLLNPIFTYSSHDSCSDWANTLSRVGYSIVRMSPIVSPYHTGNAFTFYKREQEHSSALAVAASIDSAVGCLVKPERDASMFDQFRESETLSIKNAIKLSYEGNVEQIIVSLNTLEIHPLIGPICMKWSTLFRLAQDLLGSSTVNAGCLRLLTEYYNGSGLINHWGVPSLYIRADRNLVG